MWKKVFAMVMLHVVQSRICVGGGGGGCLKNNDGRGAVALGTQFCMEVWVHTPQNLSLLRVVLRVC